MREGYPILLGCDTWATAIETFDDLPVTIIIWGRSLYSPIDSNPEFGFSMNIEELVGDEIFRPAPCIDEARNWVKVSGVVWGFKSIDTARAGAVAFFAGWCAAMRAERRRAMR